jgi:hypothetical protein
MGRLTLFVVVASSKILRKDNLMTLEALLSSLSHDEKLTALDLLWRDLASDPKKYSSPQWHGRILAERLANPAPGERLPLTAAKAEVEERLNARRTSS